MKKYKLSFLVGVILICSCSSDPTNISNTIDNTDTEVVRFPMAEPVDMGLRVHWASWNIGEDSEFKAEALYVWGDAIGNKYSGVSLDECPNAFPPDNISGSEYDIATKQWGIDWRLPLDQDFSDLWSNSTITIGEVNGTQYYKLTSKINGNYIYLPAHDDNLYASCYWTGNLYDKDSRCAITRWVDTRESQPQTYWIYMERNEPCCIRPVFEHTKVWTSDAKDIKAYSVTLNGSLSHIATIKSNSMGFYIATTQTDIENLTEQTIEIQATLKGNSISADVNNLTRNQTYYYRAFVKINGKEYLGEIKQFTTINAYLLGELWPSKENPEGVVFYINNNGTHGKIVSLNQASLVWQGGIPTVVAANDFDDGRNNTFPSSSLIAQWVANHGAGWYCPAKNELHQLSSAIKDVNSTLRQIELKPLENFFWSSTQYSVEYYDMAYMVAITENSSYMGYKNGYSTYNSKSNQHGVVAIKRF